mmetsp:Transcript_79626/g.220226  ORF Transcript_79626/g.220226 Transcript_79626/m.220226 type:complete len:85 (-) Transcript_79626:637-891(-)
MSLPPASEDHGWHRWGGMLPSWGSGHSGRGTGTATTTGVKTDGGTGGAMLRPGGHASADQLAACVEAVAVPTELGSSATSLRRA